MDSARWKRLSELFDAGLDMEPGARAEWIRTSCAGDVELAAQLERLLSADQNADAADFLTLAGGDRAPEPTPAEGRFGAYRLLSLLGRGGMGEVHLAERDDGQFEQRVALKLLSLPTPGMIQRFRLERQILARLEHPNIARLFDGGIGEHGIPYFAMEYVEGLPITRHVAVHALGVAATLDLFLRVCDAVQYAHRNLVVHRDLKPSNILVAGDGTPKLLDFGIAKLLQTTDGNDAQATITRVFTPDYAAPEQIRGEPVTTATDVYALGVVLYELLVGARPYRLGPNATQFDEAVLRADPVAPSGAVAKSATDPLRARQLRGDIDRIVLKALAKNPEHRYGSVEAFAADIRNHLGGRPIAARSDSFAYRTLKFVRRNRAGVSAAAIVLVALVAATSVSLWQAQVAREHAKRAEEKTRTAQAVKDYLLSVFGSANPYKTNGKIITARDLLEGGLDEVAKKLDGQPQVQAEIYTSFVETFVELDQLTQADRAAHLALDTYRQFLPNDAVEALRAEQLLAQVQLWGTQMDGLAERFENLLTRIGDRGGRYADLRGDVLAMLAITYYRYGQFDQAAKVGAESIAQQQRLHKQFVYETGLALYQLSLIRLAQGRAADAAPLIAQFIRGDLGLVGPEHPGLTTDVTNVGRYLHSIGRLREAHELLSAALAARMRQFPPTHSFVLRTRALLAAVQRDLGETTQAESTLAEVVRSAIGVPHFAVDDLAEMQGDRARALLRLGRLDEARASAQAAQELIGRIAAADTPVPSALSALLADIDAREGRREQALAELEPIIARQRARADRELPVALLTQARILRELDRRADAARALADAIAALAAQGRPANSLARELQLESASLAQANGDTSGAMAHMRDAAVIACVNFGCDDPRVREIATRNASAKAEPVGDSAIADIAQAADAQRHTGEELYRQAKYIVSKAEEAAARGATPAAAK